MCIRDRALIDPLPGSERNEGYPYGSDGSGRYLLHNGLDMADEAGTAAVAPFAGEVILARDDLDEHFGWRCDWYGQLVVIRAEQLHDGQPVYALFGHVADVAAVSYTHLDVYKRQGFAMVENVLYYLTAFGEDGAAGWNSLVLIRGVIFGLNHALYTDVYKRQLYQSAIIVAGLVLTILIAPQLGFCLLYTSRCV